METGANQFNNNSFFGLEDKLSRILKPVKPDTVFLDTLKQKLSYTPTIIVESSKKGLGLLILAVGLFSGALTIWLIGRAKKIKKLTQKT